MTEELTQKSLDEMQTALVLTGQGDSKIAKVIAAARRALELEEALKHGDLYLRRVFIDGTYGVTFTTPDRKSQYAEGSTPLEAINNARRGM